MTDETELEQIWAYQENAQWKERGWSPEPITYGGDQEYVRVDLYEAERQRAERLEAEKKIYESGWLEAEGIISDLQERAEVAEGERDRLRERIGRLQAYFDTLPDGEASQDVVGAIYALVWGRDPHKPTILAPNNHRRMILKHFITTAVAAVALAGMAHADDDSFNGVAGSFSGGVSTFAKSGGMSMTGSWGGDTNTSIRNESGSGEFAGASMTWSAEDGAASITGESFTDGFDFSKNRSGGGYGGSFSARAGSATANGGFSGGFANGDWDDDEGFPGLGLGHGGFDDGAPGNPDKWDDD